MAIGYDPFREFEQLTQQLLSGGRAPRSFPMDAYRRGDEFFVHLDLPGVDPGSIDVTVESGVVSIIAERRFEQKEEDEILVSERPQGRFSRELRVGTAVDVDRIDASYEGGVLTITLPVSERASRGPSGFSPPARGRGTSSREPEFGARGRPLGHLVIRACFLSGRGRRARRVRWSEPGVAVQLADPGRDDTADRPTRPWTIRVAALRLPAGVTHPLVPSST
jgi:HSP20 family protein